MKPPILSESKKRELADKALLMIDPTDHAVDYASVAQRDADAAYYEPLIEQVKAEVAREYERKLAGQEVAFGFLLEQTRDRVADEVFAYIEKIMIHLAASDTWQDVKSKYTGGKK